MENLKTKNYISKKIVNFFFSENNYNSIKLFKIIWDYKIGRHYEMSPLLKKMLTPDSITLDIGANMGQYACRLHGITEKGSGHIHSFEPVKANYTALLKMKKILNLKNLSINQLGVSNVIDNAKIYVPVFNNGLVVGTRATLQNIGNVKHRTEVIKVTTIDTYVLEHNINKIDFIKCDTEGNEVNVLHGGKNTITKHLPLLSFEMSYNTSNLDWLLDLGYELFYYDDKMNMLRKINGYQSGNLIFIHKSQIISLNNLIEH